MTATDAAALAREGFSAFLKPHTNTVKTKVRRPYLLGSPGLRLMGLGDEWGVVLSFLLAGLDSPD